MSTYLRCLLIALRLARTGVQELLPAEQRHGFVYGLLKLMSRQARPEQVGARLREALHDCGPVFVKFGQILSTRSDVLPQHVADELALLQDQVPPFPAAQARQVIEAELRRPVAELFSAFEDTPQASASVAQVHFALLPSGEEVAVKVLRPDIERLIRRDVRVLYLVARWVRWLWRDGRRLRPREVVGELEKHLHAELDLEREAANAMQLRRAAELHHLLQIPLVYWDYCSERVLVMQRMRGIPISQTERLRQAGVDLKRLAREGVEVFFTQVFRDGLFHADMHPGNILVSLAPESLGQLIALDFGIVASLSDFDKDYLARNFLAFFERDYRRVAQLHIESGWVPAHTPLEELEATIRVCCEPHFDRPLKDLSLAQVLLRLFQASRQFGVHIQPQLTMLQKTLFNVEGLGRQLDPQLDLWDTAKPFLRRWMSEQVGWRALLHRLREESPNYAKLLPELPRLLHQALQQAPAQEELKRLRRRQERLELQWQRLVSFMLGLGVALLGLALLPHLARLLHGY